MPDCIYDPGSTCLAQSKYDVFALNVEFIKWEVSGTEASIVSGADTGEITVESNESGHVYFDVTVTVTDGFTIDTATGSFAHLRRPLITLLGEAIVNIYQDDDYIDAGATAIDNTGTDITINIVAVNNLDSSIPGEYQVTYNVDDSSAIAAEEIIRIINVIETIFNQTATYDETNIATEFIA